jgi:hypothetical protein
MVAGVMIWKGMGACGAGRACSQSAHQQPAPAGKVGPAGGQAAGAGGRHHQRSGFTRTNAGTLAKETACTVQIEPPFCLAESLALISRRNVLRTARAGKGRRAPGAGSAP